MKKLISSEITNKCFDYVLKRGFPYYEYSLEEKLQEIQSIKKYDLNKVIKDNIVKQTMHGLGLCWSYFKHSWDIKSKNFKTPYEIWNDKSLLFKAIERRLKRGGFEMLRDDGSMTDSQIRKAIKTYSGVQAVSNFRPTAAAAIYKKFAGKGYVWDMSGGFGGRLLGSIISDSVKKYIATDPSTKTIVGLKKMASELKNENIEIEIVQSGSEHFVPNEKIDLCFTSPPYFNTEEYAQEETQSFKAYPTIESWNNDFLRKTIVNCKKCLKPDGYFLLNIANVRTHPTLEKDSVSISEQEGFKLIDIMHMQLSSLTSGGHKFEPVFIFKNN
jgi:hypothetical protein